MLLIDETDLKIVDLIHLYATHPKTRYGRRKWSSKLKPSIALRLNRFRFPHANARAKWESRFQGKLRIILKVGKCWLYAVKGPRVSSAIISAMRCVVGFHVSRENVPRISQPDANFRTDYRKSSPRLRAVYTVVNQLIAHRRFFLPFFFCTVSVLVLCDRRNSRSEESPEGCIRHTDTGRASLGTTSFFSSYPA